MRPIINWYGERIAFAGELVEAAPPHLLRRLEQEPVLHHYRGVADLPVAMFVARGKERQYDASASAREIFRNATGLDTGDVAKLLQFVNTWGLLGLSSFGAEPVIAVRVELKHLQRLARWAAAMGREEWKSPDIPPLPASYGSPSWQERRLLLRRLFAWKFDDAISRLGIFVRPELLAGRPRKAAYRRRLPPMKPALRPEPGLLGVLYLELWSVTVDPERKLQACAASDCSALFIRRTSNELTKYCSRRCKSRDKVRAWRGMRKASL